MLQLYGNARSRAIRCLWMLEEVGQPYELVDKSLLADDLHSADYLKLNRSEEHTSELQSQ